MRGGARAAGFTLLELLIVIAIIAVLMAAGLFSYNRWHAQSLVLQGAQEFAQRIGSTRLGAKRANACWQLKLSSSGPTTEYQVRKFDAATCSATATPVSTVTYSVPRGTSIEVATATTSNNISFYPPYGTTDVSAAKFLVKWAANPDVQRSVYVTSVLGKVIVK